MHPSDRGHRTIIRLALVAGLAIALAGCLPATVARPTGTPPPTPRPTPTPDPTPTPTPAPPTPTPAPTFAIYTVERGDTLSSIAKRFKTDARSISYWNRDRYKSLDPEAARYRPDNIKVGWELQIMPGQRYVPPEDDGESGELYTRPPEDLDPEEPEGSASPPASP
ncbi:MAG TPA: LysM domain-containing protein [Candidatus Limnocylindrales bacterium]|nr:LysM domain-containing protein [Candidatus Limnocylindrales bacterium]